MPELWTHVTTPIFFLMQILDIQTQVLTLMQRHMSPDESLRLLLNTLNVSCPNWNGIYHAPWSSKTVSKAKNVNILYYYIIIFSIYGIKQNRLLNSFHLFLLYLLIWILEHLKPHTQLAFVVHLVFLWEDTGLGAQEIRAICLKGRRPGPTSFAARSALQVQGRSYLK